MVDGYKGRRLVLFIIAAIAGYSLAVTVEKYFSSEAMTIIDYGTAALFIAIIIYVVVTVAKEPKE